MQGNFSYYNPTKLYFGDESLNYLKDELVNYGPVVLLNYGGGSVKRNGIYDQVVAILKEAGKFKIVEPAADSRPSPGVSYKYAFLRGEPLDHVA